jgi:hypothetical protein
MPNSINSLFSISLTPCALTSQQGFLLYSEHDPHLHIIIEVKTDTKEGPIKTFTIIDSSCSDNVVDSDFTEKLGIPFFTKASPLCLKLVDGTLNPSGIVKHEITTDLQIKGHHETITFDVTKIDNYLEQPQQDRTSMGLNLLLECVERRVKKLDTRRGQPL